VEWWPAYLAIGLSVGFLAGLLGIGGGMIMVPALALLFRSIGFPADYLMHLTLATAVTTIAFTSVSSVRAHHRFGAVDWAIARAMAPGIVAGAFGAGFAAGLVPTRPLAILFTAFLYFAATQMLFQPKPKATRGLPGPAGLASVGFGIGAISSLLAAGGAFLSIPFLVRCNVPLKRAIGTAAANGFPIALAGSAGYILQGLRVEGLPAGTLGFVYLPALGFIAAMSMLAAPWGARLAHRLPVPQLRVLFALMLYALATRMLAALW
jgi:uncharacterized membrane protein YfcA